MVTFPDQPASLGVIRDHFDTCLSIDPDGLELLNFSEVKLDWNCVVNEDRRRIVDATNARGSLTL